LTAEWFLGDSEVKAPGRLSASTQPVDISRKRNKNNKFEKVSINALTVDL
jgi:hypothetical protein